jgi:iron complex outermembrane receptor protein
MKLTRTPIASAVALALMGVVASAQAQTTTAPAPKGELNTVTVTGVRGALEQSLTVKRDSDSHVDVLTAEDIGKMPDKNVADSLARVPGMTISSAGATEGGFDENDRVSMRGTSPSLTQTQINGHGVASGDWFVLNQTGTVGRSVSYTLLPSELVGQVVIHKSSEASLVEGGVAGTVDIVTRKPLDFRKQFSGEVSLGVVKASLPGNTDPQFSALLNFKNDAKTMGVLIQAFSETRHLRRDGVEILGYDRFQPTDVAVAGDATHAPHPDLNGVYYPHDMGVALFEQERKRTGGLIDLQIKPSSDIDMDFTLFSSTLNASNYNRNYLLWTPHFMPGQAPDAGYVVRNNTLVQANFTAVPGTQYGIYDMISRPNESASSNFFDWDAKFRLNDALTLKTKLGTSEGHGKTPVQDVYEADTNIGTGASYKLNGSGSAPNFGFGNANVSNLSSVAGLDWIFGDMNYDVVDKEKWAQLDGEYAMNSGALTALKFGLRWNSHERALTGILNQRPALNGSAFTAANQPTTFSNYPSNFGSGLGGSFPQNVWYYTAAQVNAFDNSYAYRPTDGSRENFSSEYQVKEDNAALYVQGNFEGSGWSGNLGLRYVQTKEHVITYRAVSANTPGAVQTSLFGPFILDPTDHTYNDILPSANLKLTLNKDMDLRFALSKTMTRPDYSALAGSVSTSPPATANGIGTGNGGNPDLAPIRSNNFDATWEWYFAPRSLVSAGFFYMDLQNFVGLGIETKVLKTFDQFFPNGHDVTYNLTVPTNTSGKAQGIELAWEQPLTSNIGFSANYTYTDASETGGGPLVGASKNTYNLSGYYEDDRFNARLSYTYRSSFYSGLDRSTAFSQAGVGTLSMSLGYKFNDQFSVTFDAQNLNNPTLKYYALNEDQPRSIYQNGRQYYLNAHFKF